MLLDTLVVTSYLLLMGCSYMCSFAQAAAAAQAGASVIQIFVGRIRVILSFGFGYSIIPPFL